MTKLAIIHTTPVTVESLKALATEIMPECTTINIVDDSILPELRGNGGNIEAIKGRWSQYAKIAEEQGADCILNACSSIGELVDLVQPEIQVPIVRIDAAMAEFAVSFAGSIGVAATLPTTLQPTLRLLEEKAKQAGKLVRFETVLASTAYDKLLVGDQQGHDEELAAKLMELAAKVDLVVLAQASMARVLARFSDEEQARFLSSPRLGMERVAAILSKRG